MSIIIRSATHKHSSRQEIRPYNLFIEIVNNQAQSNDGGGLFLYFSNSVFTNNTIANNTAGDFGAAVYSEYSSPIFINSILYFNQDSTGNEIWTENSNVTVYYSDVQGGWQGQGNVDIDPMFRDPQNGDPSIFDAYLGCESGLATELSDLGAYGGQGTPATGIDDPIAELVPESFSMAQNYPNPFNAETLIEFNLSNDVHVIIDIFDTLGRKITTLVNSRRPAGIHKVVWDAASQATGVYFYRITVDGSTETRKMSLLK